MTTFGPGFERATIIAHIEGIGVGESFLRVIGTFASTGQYSSFLLINAMLCFALLFSTEKKREWLIFGGCTVFNFLALLATGSRAGLLVLWVQVFAFGVLCHRARRTLVVGALVGLSLFYGFKWMGEPVIARYESLSNLEMIRHRTTETTVEMFFDILEEYPLGRGLGTASTASRHLVGEDSSGWSLVENYPSKLQMEVGILGVLLFYLFQVALSFQWLRRWLTPLDGHTFDLVAPLTAYCLTQFITVSLFGSLDSPPGVVFLWALIGIVARLFASSNAIRRALAEHPKRLRLYAKHSISI